MYSNLTKALAPAFAVVTLATQTMLPQEALSRDRVYYYARPAHYGIYQRHPILSRTLTGAALGTATGAIVGAIAGHHRAGKGALIGAGVGTAAGLGYGLYRNHQYRRGYGWF